MFLISREFKQRSHVKINKNGSTFPIFRGFGYFRVKCLCEYGLELRETEPRILPVTPTFYPYP